MCCAQFIIPIFHVEEGFRGAAARRRPSFVVLVRCTTRSSHGKIIQLAALLQHPRKVTHERRGHTRIAEMWGNVNLERSEEGKIEILFFLLRFQGKVLRSRTNNPRR